MVLIYTILIPLFCSLIVTKIHRAKENREVIRNAWQHKSMQIVEIKIHHLVQTKYSKILFYRQYLYNCY